MAQTDAGAAALAAEAHPTPPVTAEQGWLISGGGRDVYAVTLDPQTTRAGHATVRLAPKAETDDKYGTWMRAVDAAPYQGKRVRMSVFTKTVEATTRADFWARVQASDSPGDGAGLGGQWVSLPPESDWSEQQIVFDVDPEGTSLQYGVGLAGPGTLWLDEPKLEVVGLDVAVTNGYPGEKTIGEWLLTGVGARDFDVVTEGDAVRIERKVSQSTRFVALMRVVPAAPHAGKRISASFEVKTERLDEEGACVVKAQRTAKLAYSGFLAAELEKIPAKTKGFKRCDVAIDVPDGARWLLYGFTYRGAGKAWVRGGQVVAK